MVFYRGLLHGLYEELSNVTDILSIARNQVNKCVGNAYEWFEEAFKS